MKKSELIKQLAETSSRIEEIAEALESRLDNIIEVVKQSGPPEQVSRVIEN
jgi:hypothetical protein